MLSKLLKCANASVAGNGKHFEITGGDGGGENFKIVSDGGDPEEPFCGAFGVSVGGMCQIWRIRLRKFFSSRKRLGSLKMFSDFKK